MKSIRLANLSGLLLSLVASISAAGTVFAAIALYGTTRGVTPVLTVALLIGIPGASALATFLSTQIWFFYRYERALRDSPHTDVYVDGIMSWAGIWGYGSIFLTTGGFISIMGSMTGYQSQLPFWITGGICAGCLLVTTIGLLALSRISRRWHLNRQPIWPKNA